MRPWMIYSHAPIPYNTTPEGEETIRKIKEAMEKVEESKRQQKANTS